MRIERQWIRIHPQIWVCNAKKAAADWCSRVFPTDKREPDYYLKTDAVKGHLSFPLHWPVSRLSSVSSLHWAMDQFCKAACCKQLLKQFDPSMRWESDQTYPSSPWSLSSSWELKLHQRIRATGPRASAVCQLAPPGYSVEEKEGRRSWTQWRRRPASDTTAAGKLLGGFSFQGCCVFLSAL